jgi:hypothetical protein
MKKDQLHFQTTVSPLKISLFESRTAFVRKYNAMILAKQDPFSANIANYTYFLYKYDGFP